MKINIAGSIVCLLALLGFLGCGGGGSSNSSAGGAIGYYTAGESGIVSSPWGDGTLTHRPAMAVKFTPPFYPITITSVTIYTVNETGSDQTFNLYGFGENLSMETEIFSPVLNQNIANSGISCVRKTVSIPSTTITSESFHIAVEWITKPLTTVSGSNSFFLCTDSTRNYANVNFFRFIGTTWVNSETISATGGDIGISVNY